MIFPDQIDKLVTKLTELTGKDKVEWKETGNASTYLASVDKFVVTVNKSGSEVSVRPSTIFDDHSLMPFFADGLSQQTCDQVETSSGTEWDH